MLTDRQLVNLFSEALVDEPADPTFLDELFETLVEEVRAAGLAPGRSVLPIARRAPAWRGAAQWVALAAAALAVALGLALVSRQPAVGPPPSPTPSASPSFPALTGLFTSTIGGYSMRYPEAATLDAATEAMSPGLHSWNPDQPWVDNILDPSGFGLWTIASVPIPTSMTGEQWVADELDSSLLGGSGFPACGPVMVTEQITIDGVDGTIDTHCPTVSLDAIVTSGGRAYVFSIAADSASIAWFRSVLATVHLDPAAAAPYVSPAPTAPAGPSAS